MGRGSVLVTGATGYIGGKLLPRLLDVGCDVRVLVRDVLKPDTLPSALPGIEVAWYNIHSLYAGADFHNLDLVAARNLADAASAMGVQRIIYLGGLGDPLSHRAHPSAGQPPVGVQQDPARCHR